MSKVMTASGVWVKDTMRRVSSWYSSAAGRARHEVVRQQRRVRKSRQALALEEARRGEVQAPVVDVEPDDLRVGHSDDAPSHAAPAAAEGLLGVQDSGQVSWKLLMKVLLR